jgi:hypothetical protein
MHLTRLRTCALAAYMACALSSLNVQGSTVVVSYALTPGSASIKEFTIPNPEGGPDLTIRPEITLNSGSFDALFENGTPLGLVDEGPATIRNLNFMGTISISITTTIDLGIISPAVTATLAGPLLSTQLSDATGSILGAGGIFTNTTPGLFDVTAGPLDCSSDFFDALCPILESALGISFPIEIPALENAPLPFTGAFTGLDTPGASTAGNTLDFALPLGDENSFGIEVDIQWEESGRIVLVPEPSSAIFGMVAFLILARHRQKPNHR